MSQLDKQFSVHILSTPLPFPRFLSLRILIFRRSLACGDSGFRLQSPVAWSWSNVHLGLSSLINHGEHSITHQVYGAASGKP